MKDKIKELLGIGLPANVVATTVGVSDAYVSKLLSEESFAAEVQELRVKNLAESASRDKKWNSLEDKLLEKFDTAVEFVSRPMELIKMLGVVNAAKRRAAPAELSANTQVQVVPLILPVILAPKFVMNSQAQVVEVEGRVIATMPASVVNSKLEESRRDKGAVNAQLTADDNNRAAERLARLARLDALPVHELI